MTKTFCIYLNIDLVFGILAVVFGILYGLKWVDIFIYSFDKDKDKFKGEKKRVDDSKKEAPFYSPEHFYHNFLGAFLGWMMMLFLIKYRLNYFDKTTISKISTLDLWIFLLAFVGMIGRLPDLVMSFISGIRKTAEALADLFKSKPKDRLINGKK